MTLQQLIVLALQVSILLTVFSFGLRATPEDILHVVRRPSLLGRSLVAMFLVMPILAVALARAFALRPSVEIALVALSVAPIPPLLPRRQNKAGGDAPYALGLMVVVGLLSIVIVPAGVALLGRFFMKPFAMSPGAIAAVVLKAAILPLAAGMVVRALVPAAAVRMAKAVGLVGQAMLAAGVLAILADTLSTVMSLIGNWTLLAMAAFVVVGLAVGHVLGGPNEDDRIVLAFATSSRHPAIALAMAKANFPDEPYLGATIILYLLVSILLGVAYKVWHARRAAA
jgi:BASS family bile acid:Na+ symporter